MDEENVPNVGYTLGDKVKRKSAISKDLNPETFWSIYEDLLMITKCKQKNMQWGAKKILDSISLNSPMSERLVRKYLGQYFYDDETEKMYFKSTDLTTGHRRCLTRIEMVEAMISNHKQDHRASETIYESMRKMFFPVTRETIKSLYKTELKCTECTQVKELPKTTVKTKKIPATYPNSRWQMDLKKMPPSHGFNYICNVVDCYSRFAFGAPIKGKTAKEVADVLITKIYCFGSPRILQTDNGHEFNNSN